MVYVIYTYHCIRFNLIFHLKDYLKYYLSANKKLFVKDLGTILLCSSNSTYQHITFQKGEYTLEVSKSCPIHEVENMLLDISKKFNIEYSSLERQYFQWCQVIYRQLNQIKKADFLELGYFDFKNDQYKFHFYNEKFTDINGFYPPAKFVSRTSKETDNTLSDIKTQTKPKEKVNKTLFALPLLLLFTLMTYGYFVNRDRINNYIQGIKLEQTSKIPQKTKLKPKSSKKYSKSTKKRLEPSKTKKHPVKSSTKKALSQTKISRKDHSCMIVTGSFKKLKNLNKMEDYLTEQFPDQVVKNIHGEFTRIGLQISCQDDTSLAKIKHLITEDAWILKK